MNFKILFDRRIILKRLNEYYLNVGLKRLKYVEF